MKVKHVFAALVLACSVGQSALAQEDTTAAKPEAAPAAQENHDAGASHGKSGHARSSHSRRTRKHHAKASTEAAAEADNAAGEAAKTATPDKNEAAKAAQKSADDNAAPANAEPGKSVASAPAEPATTAATTAVPAATAAVAAPAVMAVAAKAAAEPVPVVETQKSWLDGFIYGIKATDVLLALFAGLLVAIANAQLRRLRETARATAETALAAERTARTAENALIAGQRAFMFLREFKTFLHLDETTGHYRWTLHPVWENNGNTPTRDLTIYTTYRLLDAPLPKGFDFAGEEEATATIAAPKALVEAAPGDISAADLAAVQQGTKYFYIWGRAEYNDIFDGTGRHTTRFCNQLMQVIGDPTQPASEHNMVQMLFGFHDENNSAD